MNKEISKLIWLVIPIIVAVLPYIARMISLNTDGYMYGELGVIENLTVIFLFVAIIANVLFLMLEANYIRAYVG